MTETTLGDFFDVSNIQEPMKRCNTCKIRMPRRLFYKGSAGKKSKHAMCPTCHKEHSKVVKRLKKKHPPPTDPNYACPVCSLTMEQIIEERDETTKSTTWHLDHDHVTKEFRAYVCHSCNLMIGNARDNPAILQQGVEYLEAWAHPEVKQAIQNGCLPIRDN